MNTSSDFFPQAMLQSPKNPQEVQDRTNVERFQAACIKDSEVLYEDDIIYVDCTTELIKDLQKKIHRLKMVFKYKNKTPKHMDEFEVTYRNTPG